jgi:ketosteroid isomerase-like protein
VTALFTFADQWGRRTLLLRAEDAGAWRIHHLHASNLPAPPA